MVLRTPGAGTPPDARRPAGRAIDVGPGPGGNAVVLRDLGWQVTGVELHRDRCAAVREPRCSTSSAVTPRALPVPDRERRPGHVHRRLGAHRGPRDRRPRVVPRAPARRAACWSPSRRARTCGAGTTSPWGTCAATSGRSCSTSWRRRASSCTTSRRGTSSCDPSPGSGAPPATRPGPTRAAARWRLSPRRSTPACVPRSPSSRCCPWRRLPGLSLVDPRLPPLTARSSAVAERLGQLVHPVLALHELAEQPQPQHPGERRRRRRGRCRRP